MRVVCVFFLLLLAAGALAKMPFLVIAPVLLIAWLIKTAPIDSIETFYAYCGAAGVLVGLITLAQHIL